MKYQVGDVVTIRSWEAMEREFGSDSCGSIKTDIGFLTQMKPICGSQVRITEVEKDYYEIDCLDGESYQYSISDNMIAHNFSYGEEIEVSSDGEDWDKRIFVGFIDGDKYPFICVLESWEDKFKNKADFPTYLWRYARKIKQPKIEITVKINGKEAKLSDIEKLLRR